jgi:hypothetical protein
MLADDLVGGISLDALGAGIPGEDIPVTVELKDRIIDDGIQELP